MFENGKCLDVKKPFLLEITDKDADYDLTIVIPAYNEEKRLPKMMKDTLTVCFYTYYSL